MAVILLTAFLIRNNNLHADDDKISVRRGDNGLLVKYYDAHAKKNYELNLGDSSLWSYVKNICKMFNTDAEPFQRLQLNFHGFPTYMLNINTVNNDTMEMLEEVSGMVDNSVDPYADMPPLIPFWQARAGEQRNERQR
jgi:hypothetical protein